MELLNPRTAVGAAVWGVIFLGAATVVAAMTRRLAHRVGSRLSDVTGLAFVSGFAQVLAYLLSLILYAHLIPELRSLGTALLAGASVVSVVLGLAAQGTLSNLVAGLSLVLYRPFRVGDTVQLSAPHGVITARVELVALGYTILRDDDQHEVVVPNSVMASSVLVRIGTGGVSQGSSAG